MSRMSFRVNLITGVIKGISAERLQIVHGLLPSYTQTYHNTVSERASLTRSTTHNKIKPISARTKVFVNSFFAYCIKKWSKLNNKIRNIKSTNKFKVTILNFSRPKRNSVFDIHDTNGIKVFVV